MGKFRFFIEATPNYLAGVHYSQPLGLPDTANAYEKPGEVPPGGFQNFSAIAQHSASLNRYKNIEKYQTINILHKISALANFAVIAFLKNDPARKNSGQKRYRVLYLDPVPNIIKDPNNPKKVTLAPNSVNYIRGIPYQGFISSGGYPELRHSDFEAAQQLGVIIEDHKPIDPILLHDAGFKPNEKFYAIDINKLRESILKFTEERQEDERKYRAQAHLAGQVDTMFGHMTAGTGGQQVMKANNPLQGS